MSSATLLRPVERRTLPLRTEADLLAAARGRGRHHARRVAEEPPADRTLPEPAVRGGATLDELLSGAWEALLAHEAAPCPVCGGAMRPRYGSGPAVIGGRCSQCETTVA